MSIYTDRLTAAGLPVYSGDEQHATFSRSLTRIEEATADVIERELFPERFAKIVKKENAKANAAKVVEIKNLSAQQARGWLHKKLNGEVPQATEDAIGTMLELLIALRDSTMPDL